MSGNKFAHEKHSARDKAKVTPYDRPLILYCSRMVPVRPHVESSRRMERCGGELHEVQKVRGVPVYARTQICEKCHWFFVEGVPTEGDVVARAVDAKKRAREFAEELDKTGILVADGDKKERVSVALNGKHWQVRTISGAYLYAFSTTPSDIRSLKNNEAALKRLGVRWGEDAAKAAKTNGSHKKTAPAAHDGNLTPLQQHAVDLRSRLGNLQHQLGATNTDLVRLGMDAAAKRKVWKYKTEESGVVQLGRFLSGQMWGDRRSHEFFEAICDEIEGIPPEQFGTATQSVTRAPVPTPEPAPAAEPTRNDDAALIAANVEINELKKEREKLIDKFEQANHQIGVETRKSRDLREQLDKQRAETIGAEGKARALKDELKGVREMLEEERANRASTISVDDPLYLRALKRLIASSSTDAEIEEAFVMAQEIAKGIGDNK